MALELKFHNIKCIKILIQMILVMKHKQYLMPYEKRCLTFCPEGIQAKQDQ